MIPEFADGDPAGKACQAGSLWMSMCQLMRRLELCPVGTVNLFLEKGCCQKQGWVGRPRICCFQPGYAAGG